MASYINITLDTTAPSSVTCNINSSALYATQQLVTLNISTTDSNTTGYTMLIWGDVDNTYDTNIQSTQATSQYITFASSKQIKLSSGDATKTINVIVRDDVLNPSSTVTTSIILDMTIPTVTITGQDLTKISKIAGKNVSSFSFTCSANFSQYIVKVVPSTTSDHTVGTQIPTTAGSVNMSGNAGNYASSTPINCQVNGTDLQTASAGDGVKIIKVFVCDLAGNWSI